ncbi:hypothetical protein JZ751_019203 [Albula glossodonta]|uniref:Uncharacterized protein n=1 Tax=Albula glossodonta TaxID=121402 RepID=A0A8T2NP47_9TELE|nr:hypothetical protein JZ751_019203 [Albula glossodonta]
MPDQRTRKNGIRTHILQGHYNWVVSSPAFKGVFCFDPVTYDRRHCVYVCVPLADSPDKPESLNHECSTHNALGEGYKEWDRNFTKLPNQRALAVSIQQWGWTPNT